MNRQESIDALYAVIEQSQSAFEDSDESEEEISAGRMVADVIDRLNDAGFRIERAGPPDWALALLDTLFTGKRLEFDGQEIPDWLEQRLAAEYGHPYPHRPPTGEGGATPDPDDDADDPALRSDAWP